MSNGIFLPLTVKGLGTLLGRGLGFWPMLSNEERGMGKVLFS